MKLARKTVVLVAAVISISLAGLVLVQVLLLQSSRKLKEQAFQNNALTAMGTVVNQLETREAATGVVKMAFTPAKNTKLSMMAFRVGDTLSPLFCEDSNRHFGKESAAPAWVDSGILHYKVPPHQKVTITVIDTVNNLHRTVIDSAASPDVHKMDLGDTTKSQHVLVHYTNDSETFEMNLDMGDSSTFLHHLADSSRIMLVSRVIDNLVLGETVPLEKRLNREVLDTLLHGAFLSSGIGIPYQFAVSTPQSDSLRMASAGASITELKSSDLRVRLFPNDVMAKPAELIVYFPNRSSYVTSQLIPLTSATGVFMLLIAGCFIYSIVTILRQRRFAQLTVDFINNMTHEFKTPLSTVALACDALAREDVVANPVKVRQYEQMIRDENGRMRAQVDKILQMAVLEEGDYVLSISEIDAHELITTLIGSFALLVEQRQGAITTNLAAEQMRISGDLVHLRNVIANLLDNANKYSLSQPQIHLATKNDGRRLEIEITDKGMGISARDLPMVLNKYYRVQGGNIHDVKGFGIGLSYVDLMVKAMGGEIKIKSELGKGTAVTLIFPTA